MNTERKIQIISYTNKNFTEHEKHNVMHQGQLPLQNKAAYLNSDTNVVGALAGTTVKSAF